MDTDLLRRLGLHIRRLRLEKGVSQEGLADLAGLDRTYVGGIERGERNPTVKNIDKLARALEVSIKDLLDLPDALEPDGAVGGRQRAARKVP